MRLVLKDERKKEDDEVNYQIEQTHSQRMLSSRFALDRCRGHSLDDHFFGSTVSSLLLSSSGFTDLQPPSPALVRVHCSMSLAYDRLNHQHIPFERTRRLSSPHAPDIIPQVSSAIVPSLSCEDLLLLFSPHPPRPVMS